MAKKLSCSKLHKPSGSSDKKKKFLEAGGDPLTFPQNELKDVTCIREWLGKMEEEWIPSLEGWYEIVLEVCH